MNIKKYIKYLIIYVLIVLILVILLYLTSFIPREWIENNIKESAKILLEEGEDKNIKTFGKYMYTNNSTDAIMLNLVYSINTDEKFDSIMKARRNYNPEITKNIINDINGDLPHESEKYLMCTELYDTVNKKELDSFEYARYWHGYMIILRPLLVFFNIQEIRIIFEAILIFGIIILMYFITKKTNIKVGLMIMLAFLATDLLTWITTIQGMFVMILAVIISIIMTIQKCRNNKKDNLLLFITGGLTAYFDFLTTPIVSCLLPIVILNTINKDTNTYKEVIKKMIIQLISWFSGYILIWGAKWIIVDLTRETNIIQLSIKQILYRIGIESKHIIPENVNYLSLYYNIVNSLNSLSIIIYIIVYISFFINLPNKRIKYYVNSNKIVYYICGIIPILWFWVVAEHSWQHFFFTYKNMMITILCVMLIIVDNKNIKSEKKNG